MTVAAVFRILETEAAFEAQSTVLATAQAQPARMHRLVQPLHARGAAGFAAEVLGALTKHLRAIDLSMKLGTPPDA